MNSSAEIVSDYNADTSQARDTLFRLPRISGSEKWIRLIGYRRLSWLIAAGDVFCIFLSCLLVSMAHSEDSSVLPGFDIPNLVLGLLIYPMTLLIFDMYSGKKMVSLRCLAERVSLAVLLGGCLSILILAFIPHQQQTGWGDTLLLPMLIVWFLIGAWRLSCSALLSRNGPKIGVLIVGAGKRGRAVYRLLHKPFSPFKIMGFLDDDPKNEGRVIGDSAVLGRFNQLSEITERMNIGTCILADPSNSSSQMSEVHVRARARGVEFLEISTVFEYLAYRVPVRLICDEWFALGHELSSLSRRYNSNLKRLLDILLAVALLVLFSPVMLIAALAVWIDSPGPVIFRQNRVGKDGRIFTVLKFRSMRVDAEADGPQWAKKKDSRVTRVGRVMRGLHVDETPQLWNVLKGDMSLIGPRPERPEFVENLEIEIPCYQARHSVPPGVTGWAQVSYPYGDSNEDAVRKLEYDLYYVKNMSVMLDLKILLLTIGVVLLRQGAR